MSLERGTNAKHLSGDADAFGLVEAMLEQAVVAGTATYKLFGGAPVPFPIRILRFTGVMTGAGAGGMTVKLTDGTNDLTDTLSVAALADTALFTCAQVNDAYHDLEKGDTLNVVTDGTATAIVRVHFVRRASR